MPGTGVEGTGVMTILSRLIVVSCLCLIPLSVAEDLPGDRFPNPAEEIQGSTSATSESATQPVVSEKTNALLEKIDRFYAACGPIRLRAQIRGQFDVAGVSQAYSVNVVGYTDGSGLFRHEISANRTLVQTADRLILFDHSNHAFGMLKQKPARRPVDQFPKVIRQILFDENPSLLACISDQPSQMLISSADSVRGEDNELIISDSDGRLRRIQINKDGMIHSVITDYTNYLQKQGAQKVTSASVVLTYQTTDLWKVDPEQFRFEIPYTSITFPLESELMRVGSDTATTQPTIPLISPAGAPLTPKTAGPGQ